MKHILLVAALAVASIASSVSPVAAQITFFDFDTGTPMLFAGQDVPFDQTSGGMIASFRSPQGLAFSVQNDGTTFYKMSRFSGNYLWPNSIDRNVLDITFGQALVSITLTFATVDYQDNAEIPGDLLLTAYDSATGGVVGSARTHGNYLGDTYPTGTLSFTSPGQPFDVIELVVPPQPQGTTNFLVDNIAVSTTLVAPLEVSGPSSSSPLLFTTQDDLIWEDRAANNAISFNLYRDDVTVLQSGSYGTCFSAGAPASFTIDPWLPPAGVAWFYLVTGRNALGEGTMGTDSAGRERPNLTPCP